MDYGLQTTDNGQRTTVYGKRITNYSTTDYGDIKMNFKENKKLIWILIGITSVVLIIVGLNAFQTGSEETDTQTGDTVTAFMGDLSASATASGSVMAQRDAALAFVTGGTVETIFVEVGDSVTVGTPLVQLVTSDLERAVANAEQSLIIQETNLESLLEPASVEDIAAKETAVFSAQVQLDDLLDGPDESDIASAEASLRAAQADLNAAYARLNDARESASAEEIQAAQIQLNLAQTEATSAAEWHSTTLVMEPQKRLNEDRIADMEESARLTALQASATLAEAQEVYDTVVNGDSNNIASLQAGAALSQASVASAQAQLDLVLEGPSASQIASAESSLAREQANLASLQNGASAERIAIAEAQVEQARIALQNAQHNLEDATLKAPFAGTITAVSISPGEQTGSIAIEMVDPTSLEVVLDVDEVDIGEIGVGQTAVITLESWPTKEINAQVASIAPKNTTVAGSALVTYEVYLSLGETDLPILVGMTANAQLITEQKTDVLLIPNQAITPDRAAGKYYVNLITGETTEKVEVTIGLSDGENTQITSGLDAGDQLIIGDIAPTQSFGLGRDNGDGGPFGG